MQIASDIWRSAKRWRVLSLGPVSIIYRMRRTVHVSNNHRRQLIRKVKGLFRFRAQNLKVQMSRQGAPVGIAPQTHIPLVDTALVVGFGPGLGESVARKLAESGMHVALVARNAERIDPFARGLEDLTTATVRAYACDATHESSVKSVFALVSKDLGTPSLVIYSLQGSARCRALDVELAAFEEYWRQNCLGAFIVAREAARRMLALERGTIVLIGSTSGMLARSDHLTLAVGKFGLRALAHVLARELGHRGIHVVHLVIDADIKENEQYGPEVPQADPDDLADLIYSLHRQPRSAWTSEIDVRPWNEKFWEHC